MQRLVKSPAQSRQNRSSLHPKKVFADNDEAEQDTAVAALQDSAVAASSQDIAVAASSSPRSVKKEIDPEEQHRRGHTLSWKGCGGRVVDAKIRERTMTKDPDGESGRGCAAWTKEDS